MTVKVMSTLTLNFRLPRERSGQRRRQFRQQRSANNNKSIQSGQELMENLRSSLRFRLKLWLDKMFKS